MQCYQSILCARERKREREEERDVGITRHLVLQASLEYEVSVANTLSEQLLVMQNALIDGKLSCPSPTVLTPLKRPLSTLSQFHSLFWSFYLVPLLVHPLTSNALFVWRCLYVLIFC